jgi:hypothetical protein
LNVSATTTKFGTFWTKRSLVGQKRLVHYFEQNSYCYHGHKRNWYTNFWLYCGSWFIILLVFRWEHLQCCSVCDPAKNNFTSKFSYVLFCNSTHKTATGTSNRWGTT